MANGEILTDSKPTKNKHHHLKLSIYRVKVTKTPWQNQLAKANIPFFKLRSGKFGWRLIFPEWVAVTSV